MVEALEIVHNTGYTYNDLKPQNIMVDKDDNGYDRAILIDFGLCKSYNKTKSSPININENTEFQGNLIFSSLHQMEFKRTTRKHDFESLCYLIISLLNDFQLPGFNK
jgi:serine/threonine protein kinase